MLAVLSMAALKGAGSNTPPWDRWICKLSREAYTLSSLSASNACSSQTYLQQKLRDVVDLQPAAHWSVMSVALCQSIHCPLLSARCFKLCALAAVLGAQCSVLSAQSSEINALCSVCWDRVVWSGTIIGSAVRSWCQLPLLLLPLLLLPRLLTVAGTRMLSNPLEDACTASMVIKPTP
jgi:hypothetical protein